MPARTRRFKQSTAAHAACTGTSHTRHTDSRSDRTPHRGRCPVHVQYAPCNGRRVRADNDRVRAHDDRVRADNERVRAHGDRVRAYDDRVRAHDDRERAYDERVRADDDRGRAECSCRSAWGVGGPVWHPASPRGVARHGRIPSGDAENEPQADVDLADNSFASESSQQVIEIATANRAIVSLNSLYGQKRADETVLF